MRYKLFKSLLLLFFAMSAYANNESTNELSFGIGITEAGTISKLKGMHTAVTGNLGTNVKNATLTNDDFKFDYIYSIDYFRKLSDSLYLNAGLSQTSFKTIDTKVTFDVGGYEVDPFPNIEFKGTALSLGPSYRFNTDSNFTPYVGLNVSYFSGKQSDTNYPTDSGTGTYGVGGPETDVNCWGYAPIIGVFANSGFLKGFGLSSSATTFDCEGGSQRGFTSGYDAKFTNMNLKIDYRIFY